ncbi:hypothetical protein PS914_00007 [Pseudomonas fluorescens]|uniref:Uncharacterized protein n=1 Tax=Pseudomonas fluorescens TaxID=294 RepID=A0A5E7BWL9_PSEFL|nr:hypothetical protein PS833_02278 [Pseudomonas fluorescens]VVP65081.1 hypothetical protein PS914_00007 [Pseudomonas fluorescens]
MHIPESNTGPCRSELAREDLKSDALIQKERVIVNVLREQARSYAYTRACSARTEFMNACIADD